MEGCDDRSVLPPHRRGAGTRRRCGRRDVRRDLAHAQPRLQLEEVLERTAGYAGRIPPEIYGPINWEDHYARIEFAEPSAFATALLARADLPSRVVDLGTGCGRDAIAFAASGRTVLGLDRSARAIDRARARIPGAGAGGTTFEVADLGVATAWVPTVRAWIEAGRARCSFTRASSSTPSTRGRGKPCSVH